MHYGAEKVGMLVIRPDPATRSRQVMLMQDFRTTVFHTTPSYALVPGGLSRAAGH